MAPRPEVCQRSWKLIQRSWKLIKRRHEKITEAGLDATFVLDLLNIYLLMQSCQIESDKFDVNIAVANTWCDAHSVVPP